MVKSRSSTSSIFRAATLTNSISRSSSIFSETSLSGYDTDSIITFRPIGSDRYRPPDLQLGHSNKNPSGRHPYTPSLPVTPGTPPTPSQFPSDPFSHPTSLPEPTRSRPGSLAHTLERAGKGPEIVVASPSTSTVHYLFPTSISVSGTHLSAEEGRPGVTRSAGSQRKKKGSGRTPVDAFSAPTRRAKEESLGYRTSRTGSEPVIGLKESKTLDSASMRTLRRQPSLADLGTRGRFRGNKENENPEKGVMTLEKVVEDKRNKALGLSTKINTSDLKPLSPVVEKSNISDPIAHPSPNRRRSLSLATPRPAPSVPCPTSPESPQLPAPNFGKPLHIEVGDLIPSGSYSHIEYSANGAIPFTNPFGFPGGVPMTRGSTRAGLGGVDAGKIAARLDAERRLAARNSVHQAIPVQDVGVPMERPLSLSGRVRRSLSLKISSEAKSNRRRSQSVTARGEKQWDTSIPLPSMHDLGLGDPSVDMDDKYAPAKIPSSRSLGLGLDVDVLSDIGQRSPQRKRIDLGGSGISLLASTVGLGFSPLDSPISLPESFLAEAVDLTGRGRKVVSPQSTASTSSQDQDRTERSSARPTPALSARSTPYPSESQSTTPNFASNFTSPMPQTPHSFAQLPNPPQIHTQLASPAQIHSPAIEDNTTKYTVTSRKPNLRYSKSFSSDISGKVSRNFSWRGRSSATSKKIPDIATCGKVEAAVEKEKRLSRSLSTVLRTRSPVPPEMRYTEANASPIAENRPRIVRQPSNGDIHRWRTPTLYSLCSPDGAVDPLPTPPRLGSTPYVSITMPATPDLNLPTNKSPFLAASTSFRGSFKSLTKSLSRTFDRHHANDQVKQADSALKARISGPLEVMPEKDRYSLRHRAQPPPPARPERPERSREDDQKWRETLLSQAVSHSIKDGLCELANTRSMATESHFDPSSIGRSDRTSWSHSVGKTFGLRSSSSGFGSVREGSGSYSRRSKLLVAEGNTRGLKEVGKEESNMSVYSTASYLPQSLHARSPMAISQAPFLPEVLPSPPLSSPPIEEIPEFPFVPTHTTHSSSPIPQPYFPQPLLNKLSSLSANQIPIQGREERVKKVLNWRREVGDDDALEGMIVRHVEKEGEVLRGIMKRSSVGPSRGI